MTAPLRALGALRSARPDGPAAPSAVVDLQRDAVVGLRLPGAPAGSPGPVGRLFVDAEHLGGALMQPRGTGGGEGPRVVAVLPATASGQRLGPLVAEVERSRALGCEVALRATGTDLVSAPLLALVEPDVVVLGADLLWSRAEAVVTAVHAARAHAERTGAVLLAEDLDYDSDRRRALELGARWGSGPGVADAHPCATGGAPVAGSAAGLRRARPRRESLTTLTDAAWVRRRLADLLATAAPDAAESLLLLDLSDAALVPEGLPAGVGDLQEAFGLTVVALEVDPDGPTGAPERRGSAGADDVRAVLLGPSVAWALTARPRSPGRYDVLVETSPDDVARAARRFVAARA